MAKKPQATTEHDPDEFIFGRHAVEAALKAGTAATINKLFVQTDLKSEPIQHLVGMAQKKKILVSTAPKQKLDLMSDQGNHQGVLLAMTPYAYATLDDLFKNAADKGEDPFFLLLDNLEDPHNLGSILRTADASGVHGVIIPKRRAAGLTATVAKTSAGALNYTPVARVTNIARTIEELKKEGLWFVCADMGGTSMYQLDLKGPIGLVIGNEGEGVSRMVKEKCDFVASIPMKGDIDSLNASVAAGVLAYEIVRQRLLG